MNCDEDSRYGQCAECLSVGYEVTACSDCGGDVCPFCEHSGCEEGAR